MGPEEKKLAKRTIERVLKRLCHGRALDDDRDRRATARVLAEYVIVRPHDMLEPEALTALHEAFERDFIEPLWDANGLASGGLHPYDCALAFAMGRGFKSELAAEFADAVMERAEKEEWAY